MQSTKIKRKYKTVIFENLKNEIWEKHPEYELKCSNKGRIISENGEPSFGWFDKEKGYYSKTWRIDNNNKSMSRLSHRLIMETFDPVGEIITMYMSDEKPVVDHIDGDKSNNVLENLEWVTRSENSKRYHAKKLPN